MTVRTIYKLTDQNMQTYGGCQWVLGEWQEAPGTGLLCSEGWLHRYDDPLLAVLLNSIHAGFRSPKLFLGEAEGAELSNYGLKFGDQRQRLMEELPLPTVTTINRVAFGILCAMAVYQDASFQVWGARWLTGVDRSEAEAEAEAARAAAGARAAAAAGEAERTTLVEAAEAAEAAGEAERTSGSPTFDLKRLAREAMAVN